MNVHKKTRVGSAHQHAHIEWMGALHRISGAQGIVVDDSCDGRPAAQAPETCEQRHGIAGTKAEHMPDGRGLKHAPIGPQMLLGGPRNAMVAVADNKLSGTCPPMCVLYVGFKCFCRDDYLG